MHGRLRFGKSAPGGPLKPCGSPSGTDATNTAYAASASPASLTTIRKTKKASIALAGGTSALVGKGKGGAPIRADSHIACGRAGPAGIRTKKHQEHQHRHMDGIRYKAH